jgi:hypothetical protein
VGDLFAFPLFGYAVETVALLGSAGPRRGLQLMTWRAWTLTVVAAVCGGLAWLAFVYGTFALAPHRHLMLDLSGVLPQGIAGLVVAGSIVAWMAARSALGRRVLLLFAVPLYVLLTTTAYLFAHLVDHVLLTYLPPLAAAGLGLRAIRRSRRRGPRGEQAA